MCKYLLGLEIKQTDDHISIGQSGYMRCILEQFGMSDCNGRATPLDPGTYLPRSINGDERVNVRTY